MFCHVYGRAKTASQFIPVCLLLRGRAGAGRHVLDRDPGRGPARTGGRRHRGHRRPAAGCRRALIAAGQWQAGDPYIVIVSDGGYDVTRLAWVLRDLPVELVGRVRSDRVMRLPKPPRMHGVNGRPPKHGPEFRFTEPETWPEPAITTVTDTTNYGKAEAQAWDRVHPRLTHRSSWLDHDGELPLVEGHVDPAEGRAPVERTGRSAMSLPDGVVTLVGGMIFGLIMLGGVGRVVGVAVVQGAPVPGRDHLALCVAVLPVPTQLS
ncbi:transposase [Streptomyces sp. Lzd4kr]|nr:transposase [Streptomyces sp. Lzd4kr]